MSRLRPYDSRSSALVEIPGTGAPIIAHQLAWLKSEGVTDVVISSAYHPALMEWVEGADLSLNVMVLAETDELGRGGELKHAASALPRRDEPWIAIHGDTWMRFSVRDMAVFHQEKLAVATMALVRPRIPWSTVETDSSGYVVELNDARYSPYLINAGVYVFAANFADLLPEVGDHERTIFPLLARERRLAGFRLPPSSYWQTLEGDKVAAEAAARTEDQRS